MFVEIGRAFFAEGFVEGGFVGFANITCHLDKGSQGTQVDAAAHAIGTPKFDVVRIVMGFDEYAFMVGVPRFDTIVETAFGQGIHFFEPLEVP